MEHTILLWLQLFSPLGSFFFAVAACLALFALLGRSAGHKYCASSLARVDAPPHSELKWRAPYASAGDCCHRRPLEGASSALFLCQRSWELRTLSRSKDKPTSDAVASANLPASQQDLCCRKKKKIPMAKNRLSQSKIENCTSGQRLKIQTKISHTEYFCSRNCLTSKRILEMT